MLNSNRFLAAAAVAVLTFGSVVAQDCPLSSTSPDSIQHPRDSASTLNMNDSTPWNQPRDTISTTFPHGEGNSPYAGNALIYDPSTMVSEIGVVLSIDSSSMPGDTTGSARVILRTDIEDSLIVLACPRAYLDSEGFSISPNDTLEVTGSRIDDNGEGIVIASKLRLGPKTVSLRNENGAPLWAPTHGTVRE